MLKEISDALQVALSDAIAEYDAATNGPELAGNLMEVIRPALGEAYEEGLLSWAAKRRSRKVSEKVAGFIAEWMQGKGYDVPQGRAADQLLEALAERAFNNGYDEA